MIDINEEEDFNNTSSIPIQIRRRAIEFEAYRIINLKDIKLRLWRWKSLDRQHKITR